MDNRNKLDNNLFFLYVFALPLIITSKKSTFRVFNREINVNAPGALVKNIVKECNGYRNYTDVVEKLSSRWERKTLIGFLNALIEKNILINSRNFSDVLWKTVENPPLFPTQLSEDDIQNLMDSATEFHKENLGGIIFEGTKGFVSNLLQKRKSTRSFSGLSVPFEQIVNILLAGYGSIVDNKENQRAGNSNSRRTVPSGGALYPLLFTLILFKETDTLAEGIYNVRFPASQKVELTCISQNALPVFTTIYNPLTLSGSQGVVVISGSFQKPGQKYGNRSLLYTILEAGHAAQNIHIIATEQGVGTVEIGGFNDSELSKTIQLPATYHTLITIPFGKEGKRPTPLFLERQANTETLWQKSAVGSYEVPYFICYARNPGDTDWCGGRDASPVKAFMKSVAEMEERNVCAHIPSDLISAKISALPNAIHPKDLIDFLPIQYRKKHFHLKPFQENVEYMWATGLNALSGEPRHIIADRVFYPYHPSHPHFAYGDSSGVAAHTDSEQAIQRGVLELVERDAFMNRHLTQTITPTIVTKSLPEHLQQRIKKLKDIGFKVWIKDYSIDLAPVVFVFLQSEKLHFTTCGASSNFDFEQGIDHALMEAEGSVLARLESTVVRETLPQNVRSPEDHGLLYQQKKYFKASNFLVEKGHSIDFKDIGKGTARNWSKFIDTLQKNNLELIVYYHTTPHVDLHVIRSIIPGLVPITFGYGQEPLGMKRIQAVRKKYGMKQTEIKHVSLFPHVFN